MATAPIDSPMGVIEPGQVAGRKFHWEALVGDEVVVRVTVNWLMGEENLDPAWTFGPEGQRYEMEVRGNPDIIDRRSRVSNPRSAARARSTASSAPPRTA